MQKTQCQYPKAGGKRKTETVLSRWGGTKKRGDMQHEKRSTTFGKFLSSMVMPNIGAFIAWGFITALFIEKGWLPNAQLATLNGPMLNYLLPVLIAIPGW